MKKILKVTFVCLLAIAILVLPVIAGCKKTIATETTGTSATSVSSSNQEESGEKSAEDESTDAGSSSQFTAAAEPFTLPVDIRYLETAFTVKRPAEGDTYETTFLLDEGTEINAVFAGRVLFVKELEQFLGEDATPFYWVETECEDNIMITYLLIGEVLVAQDDTVSQNQKIAVSGGGDFTPSSEGNLKIRIAQENQDGWKYFDLLLHGDV